MTAPYYILSGRDKACTECCVGTSGCEALLNCETWPPRSLQFTLSGLTNDSDCGVCCLYDPAGPADCLNREWSIPYDPLFSSECSPGFIRNCNSEPNVVGIALYTFVRIRSLITVTPTTVVVVLRIVAGLFSQIGAQTPWTCGTSRGYSKTYNLDDFNCTGPWQLDDTGEVPDSGIDSCEASWPSTLTVTPSSDDGDSDPECCDPPDAGNCGFAPCDDPPCGSGTDGSTPCCEAGEQAIGIAIIAEPGADPCLESMFDLFWLAAYAAWVGNKNLCGVAVKATLWCTSGEVAQYYFRLWVNGVLKVDAPVTVEVGDSLCAPVDIHYGVTIPGFGSYTIHFGGAS